MPRGLSIRSIVLLSSLLLAGAAAATTPVSDAPMTLTASDGTGLQMTRLEARATVQEPLAFTELHLQFTNPADRVIEGQFRITLPPGATVSRFAMKLNDRWQEGEVVERQAARRAYEDFLHRRQDPALLEQGAGNEFTARVFPIPARGVKDVIISYSQELSNRSPYRLPLRGLPLITALDVSVTRGGDSRETKRIHHQNFVPDSDFVLEPSARRTDGLRNGELLVARVRPIAELQPDPIESLVVLVDTSASRALGFGDEVRLLQKLIEGVARSNGRIPLSVAAFDQTVVPLFEGTVSSFSDDALRRLRDRKALGASNLVQALGWVGAHNQKGRGQRVWLLTDGVATAGRVEGSDLAAAALALRSTGVLRIDAIAVGGIRDEAALARITSAGLAHDGVVADGASELPALLTKLTQQTNSRLDVNVAGAKWFWPRVLSGAQTGDEFLIYADLPAGASGSTNISVGGKQMTLGEVTRVERPLIERAVVQARINSLVQRLDTEAKTPEQKSALRAEIIGLSVANRVLSPYTALLVLETEQDYARFNIDRRALADILVVNEVGQIELSHRTPDMLVVAPPAVVANSRRELRFEKLKAPRMAQEDPLSGAADQKELKASDELSADRQSPSEAALEPMRGAPLASTRSAVGAPARPMPPRLATAPSTLPPVSDEVPGVDPYTGRFKTVMDAIAHGDRSRAVTEASGWHEEDPGDVMALVAFGAALEAAGDEAHAARAYGSIIDLFPARADLRRFAGERLEHVANQAGADLAIDTFAKAAIQRPDHPASHRLLAFALLRKGLLAQAFEAALTGSKQHYPEGRFAGADRILREDLGLIAAAWMKSEPSKKNEILGRLLEAGGTPETAPSLRFVLNWETDANDVDFHIRDGRGNHAFYSAPHLVTGGDLYADVTTGYGPECFTIRLPRIQRTYPYRLQAHYYSRGPMGYGMGKLQIIDHDGKGGITFEDRPFVVMVDQAFVDMGTVLR